MRRIALACLALLATTAVVPVAGAAERATAVIALNDTGINPYHDAFADNSPRAYRHPSTYLSGFPRGAQALRLTLDEPNYWKALDRDCERVWAKVKPGRLYWVPGTRIVGAISFTRGVEIDCSDPQPADAIVLDTAGHGTMTASRAAGTGMGACADCLVVAVEGWGKDFHEGVDWITRNAAWIDVQSHSWGLTRPFLEPTGTVSAKPEFARSMERAAATQPFFRASGNAALFVGQPVHADPQYTPSTIVVGAHDSGSATLWHGFTPDVVADGCGARAARAATTSEAKDDEASGTSSATPWAAGTAARLILEARRALGSSDTGVTDGTLAKGAPLKSGPLADGDLTLGELTDVMFHTAIARPEGDAHDGDEPCPTEDRYGPVPVEWKSVPEEAPAYLSIGYGAIDDAATALALDVLMGRTGVPERAGEDAFFEQQRTLRDVVYTAFTTVP